MNETAAALVNLSGRAAQGRSVLPFFDGDRRHVQGELACAASGQICELRGISCRTSTTGSIFPLVDYFECDGSSCCALKMSHTVKTSQ